MDERERTTRELIDGYLDEVLGEGERAELGRRLREQPQAARDFVRAARLDQALHRHFRQASAVAAAREAAGAVPLPAVPAAAPAWRRRLDRTVDHAWGPLGAVLLHAAVLLILVRVIVFERPPSGEPVEVAVVRPDAKDLDATPPERPAAAPPEVVLLPPERAAAADTDSEPAAADRDANRFLPLDLLAAGGEPTAVAPAPLLADRRPAGRRLRLERHAGPWARAVEEATGRGVAWLRAAQRADGSWGDGADGDRRAVTALAVLALASRGETFAETAAARSVERATGFLARDPGAEPAAPAGLVDAEGLSIEALAEAYALTRVPALRAAVEQAAARLVRAQEPDGSWSGRPGEPDLPATAARASGLAAAASAGVETEGCAAAVQRAVGHLKGLQDPAGGLFRGSAAGRFGAPSPEMTAVAVAALQRLGHGRSPEVRRGLTAVARVDPSWDAPDAPGWRLAASERAAVALYNAGGRDWVRWRDACVPELLARQSADGAWAAPSGPEQALGAAYATAQATLSLAACYRYPPTDAALAAGSGRLPSAWPATLALLAAAPPGSGPATGARYAESRPQQAEALRTAGRSRSPRPCPAWRVRAYTNSWFASMRAMRCFTHAAERSGSSGVFAT